MNIFPGVKFFYFFILSALIIVKAYSISRRKLGQQMAIASLYFCHCKTSFLWVLFILGFIKEANIFWNKPWSLQHHDMLTDFRKC